MRCLRPVALLAFAASCGACASRPVGLGTAVSGPLPATGETRTVRAEACGMEALGFLPLGADDRLARASRELETRAGDDFITDVRLREQWRWGLWVNEYCSELVAKAIRSPDRPPPAVRESATPTNAFTLETGFSFATSVLGLEARAGRFAAAGGLFCFGSCIYSGALKYYTSASGSALGIGPFTWWGEDDGIRKRIWGAGVEYRWRRLPSRLEYTLGAGYIAGASYDEEDEDDDEDEYVGEFMPSFSVGYVFR